MEEDDFFRPQPKPKPSTKKRKLRNIPKQIREFVRERDHHQCVRCGARNGLQLHHLITKGRYDPRLYNLKHVHDPRNLATVCGVCHRLIHDDPDVMREMLEWQKFKFGNVRREFDQHDGECNSNG